MTITIADGRGALWQWDTGRRVKITDGVGVKQIHYQKRCFGHSVDVDVGDDGTAIIPDELLQDYHTLTAYAYVTDDAGGYTKVQQDFAVYKRPKPSDYVYTPTEHAGFDRLRDDIGDLADLTTEAKENLVAAINEAAASGGSSPDAVLYTPQTLTYAQKKQARENIDAASIDFVINGTLNDDALTLDKTYAQIQEAVQAGKSAVLKVEVYGVGFVLPLIGKSSSSYLFATAATVFPTITIQFNAVVGESETVWHTEHIASYDSDGNLVQNPMDRDPSRPMEIATKQYVDASGVPSVTAADNGKFLRVVNSAWSAEDMPTSGTDMGITGATVGQIAKITAVDASGVPTAWSPVDMPSGGGGGGEAGAKEFRLIRSITLGEQSDRVDISVDSSGNAFALHEVYVRIAAQSYEDAYNEVIFLPNGRWGSGDAYITSANKASKSSDTWKNNMVFHSVYADGVICSEQLPAKGQNNGLTSLFATGQSIITKISIVCKFAAGCTFLVIGR